METGDFLTRWIFLRLLGVIYLIAFISLWTQLDGLIGSNGILPASELMESVRQRFPGRFDLLPTLAWFDASDQFLHLLCSGGIFLSLFLIVGMLPSLTLFLLWLFYLSLTVISGVFLSFQWDILLLETGFLAIFFSPFKIFPRISNELPPSKIMLWLLRWLLFRLMFESGMVKLLSGDATWRSLTALNFHYETQPLPTWIGWYAHQMPEWFQKTSVAIMFGIELIVPFFIFGPRRLRFFACVVLTAFQVLIAATGNYCFFNLLTLLLCVLLLDDAVLEKWTPNFLKFPPPKVRPYEAPIRKYAIIPVAIVVLFVSTAQMASRILGRSDLPRPIQEVLKVVGPFRSINTYGLFAVMTTERPEIVVEGSHDGENWIPYEFKYKPSDLKNQPSFVAPHQPRLDWQMWFAALGRCEHNRWFVRFLQKLLEGSPEVLKLLADNPFPEGPPRYIRSTVYDYHFNDILTKKVEGNWWRRELRGAYCPVLKKESLSSPQ